MAWHERADYDVTQPDITLRPDSARRSLHCTYHSSVWHAAQIHTRQASMQLLMDRPTNAFAHLDRRRVSGTASWVTSTCPGTSARGSREVSRSSVTWRLAMPTTLSTAWTGNSSPAASSASRLVLRHDNPRVRCRGGAGRGDRYGALLWRRAYGAVCAVLS